jgi:pimeloyl-ACP methyl ester carboxylesterase
LNGPALSGILRPDRRLKMVKNVFVLRSGRKLEVTEYGDRSGHPAFFFHGLIGSHHQASYIALQAREERLRIIAPNRPGVGSSELGEHHSALDTAGDVEEIAEALGLEDFSVIGISGGTPYALAALLRHASRVRTVTVISGMGPMQLPGALPGMDLRRRAILEAGSRYPYLSRTFFQQASVRFRADPERFLDRLIATWSAPDRKLFERSAIYDLFLRDLHEVFTRGKGPESLAQELRIYRRYGFSLRDLPADKRIMFWHGLSDNIVPPAMTWKMAQTVSNCEAHFVPGGHFVAIEIAGQIISRLRQMLDDPALAAPLPGRAFS